MRKKILYIITKSNWGGAQKYVFEMAVSAKRFGYEVAVILGKPRTDTIETGKGVLLERLEEASIRTIELPTFQRDINFREELCSLITLIKVFQKEKPDIVHVNSSKAGGLGVVAARLYSLFLLTPNLKPRIIFTVHGWPFMEPRSFISRFIILFFSWLTVLFSNASITLSKENFAQGERLFLVNPKIKYIPNGINGVSTFSRGNARNELATIIRGTFNISIPADAFLIGTITEFVPNKGVAYLVDSVARVIGNRRDRDIFCCIIGDGYLRPDLETRILRFGLGTKIFLLGFVPQASRLLPAFDLFVLPSLKEGLPYVLLEAGLAKLPVIASRIYGITDIIDEKTGLLVEPKNVEELTRGIEHLLTHNTHNNECENLGVALHEKVTRDFNFQKMLQKTLELY